MSDPEKKVIPFNYDEDWVDENSDTFIQNIELIADKQKLKPKSEYKSTFVDKLVPLGCGLIVITLLISIVLGFVTMFNWLF